MVGGTVTSASHEGRAAWDVVIGDRFIAALGAPADVGAISALAEAAGDPGVGIERLVEAVPGPASDRDQGFAIVWWPDDGTETVTAVVRGTAIVDLESPGGSRRFDARGIRPWHLAEFRDVTGVRVSSADAPLDRIGTAPDRLRQPRASLRASTIEWVATPVGPATPDEPDGVGDTVLRGLRPPPGAATAPLAVDEVPHRRRGSTEADVPASDEHRAGPPDARPVVRIGDGEARTIGPPILIGRRPRAPLTPFGRDGMPELVAVRSPTGVVSGTHLELRVEGSRLVATDLRSTNGTLLRTPDGTRRLRAGESIVVVEGSSLDLGDDTIVEVLPPKTDDTDPTRDDRPSP
jgi:hypothetical protein